MAVLAITGANGLLGFHFRAFLFARYRDQFERIVLINRDDFDNESILAEKLSDCDVIVHLAAQIIGEADILIGENRWLSKKLTRALQQSNKKNRHLIFASSTHIERDTPYGQSKREAGDHFSEYCNASGDIYTPIVFPNIFGEFGRPFYNSVVSTFCHQLVRGVQPEIHQDSILSLMHAQQAAQCIMDVLLNKTAGVQTPRGQELSVSALLNQLQALDRDRRDFLIPDLSSPMQLDLYNTLRSYISMDDLPVRLNVRSDPRGDLFESLRSKHGGQVFVSMTKPAKERGNHFHLRKVERFCVLSGDGNIRLRRLFRTRSDSFQVYGQYPCVIDIPTFYAHSIQNYAERGDLITLFWAHEIFDPNNSDTYPEPVDVRLSTAPT